MEILDSQKSFTLCSIPWVVMFLFLILFSFAVFVFLVVCDQNTPHKKPCYMPMLGELLGTVYICPMSQILADFQLLHVDVLSIIWHWVTHVLHGAVHVHNVPTYFYTSINRLVFHKCMLANVYIVLQNLIVKSCLVLLQFYGFENLSIANAKPISRLSELLSSFL